ncbi:MAG: hypothetical protein WAZ18_02715 [Alphaproteobacteria bacterium]
MTYFLLISLPLMMGAALIGAWFKISPYILAVILILLGATWLFG